ncbi:hypothetical protein CathTA2_0016, partial [Caldalkalibacillus thermarum TA2.A1]
MGEESLSIAHKYISLEWARKTLEHDLKQVQKAGLKYPALFEEAAVRVLDKLSIQMRDIKKEMQEKGIKVVYKGRKKHLYEAIEYDLYGGNKKARKGLQLKNCREKKALRYLLWD